MYEKEIEALKKVNRFRKRKILNGIDFASNDYLGLASNKKILKKTCKKLSSLDEYASKASMLVNGYTKSHKKLEKLLAKINNFEKAIIVGSGFLANISLFESLVRKGDILIVDEEFHASGILATKLVYNVEFFKHNDINSLEEKLKLNAKRKIVAIEGIYSMSGDIAKKEIFDIVDKYNALLIIDEAHSNGVIGKNLLGILDYYNLDVKQNYIKMGTFGKAYGSYGAYILASKEIISFLENRAKPIIYSTALSVFDTTYAYYSVKYIQKNKNNLLKKKENLLKLIKEELDIDINSLILPIEIGDDKKVLKLQSKLLKKGFIVGAIRRPTVESAILRIIVRLNINSYDFLRFLRYLKSIL